MGFYGLVLGVLAVWRLTHLLAAEDGPGDLLVRLRRSAGNGFWGDLLDCFYCLSLWIAVPFALLLASGWKERLLTWLALSGGAILLERATGPRSAVPPASYFEDEKPAGADSAYPSSDPRISAGTREKEEEEMSRNRIAALVGLAVWLAVVAGMAACSTGTGNGTGTGATGGQVTVKPTPAAAEPPETPPDTMGGSMESPGAGASNDAQLRAAIGVAQQWLGYVDIGQYAESWAAAGQLFQANMQQQQWVQTLTGARTPLGTVVSREVAGSEIRSSLPGAPAGQYALVSFATNFQNKPDIIETVTMVDESGQWKVVGYSANPRATLEQQQAQPTPTPPQL